MNVIESNMGESDSAFQDELPTAHEQHRVLDANPNVNEETARIIMKCGDRDVLLRLFSHEKYRLEAGKRFLKKYEGSTYAKDSITNDYMVELRKKCPELFKDI